MIDNSKIGAPDGSAVSMKIFPADRYNNPKWSVKFPVLLVRGWWKWTILRPSVSHTLVSIYQVIVQCILKAVGLDPLLFTVSYDLFGIFYLVKATFFYWQFTEKLRNCLVSFPLNSSKDLESASGHSRREPSRVTAGATCIVKTFCFRLIFSWSWPARSLITSSPGQVSRHSPRLEQNILFSELILSRSPFALVFGDCPVTSLCLLHDCQYNSIHHCHSHVASRILCKSSRKGLLRLFLWTIPVWLVVEASREVKKTHLPLENALFLPNLNSRLWRYGWIVRSFHSVQSIICSLFRLYGPS